MDKTQLITIIVSAIAGAVAKETVGWMISALKGLSLIPTAYGKVKAFFSGRTGNIIVDLFNLGFFLSVLVYFANSSAAVTRVEILIVIGAVLMSIVFAVSVLWHIGMWLEDRRKN